MGNGGPLFCVLKDRENSCACLTLECWLQAGGICLIYSLDRWLGTFKHTLEGRLQQKFVVKGCSSKQLSGIRGICPDLFIQLSVRCFKT